MAEKALFTVGVFAGIVSNANWENWGKLLLRRRVEQGSILPGQSFKGCWELPGGGVLESEKISYAYLSKELEREVGEELGIQIQIDPMPAFFPASIKGPKGYDLALVVRIFADTIILPKGEVLWVSPHELEQLAREFVAPNKQTGADGQGLLSGFGKRMHCMALSAMSHGPNNSFLRIARAMLAEIQKDW